MASQHGFAKKRDREPPQVEQLHDVIFARLLLTATPDSLSGLSTGRASSDNASISIAMFSTSRLHPDDEANELNARSAFPTADTKRGCFKSLLWNRRCNACIAWDNQGTHSRCAWRCGTMRSTPVASAAAECALFNGIFASASTRESNLRLGVDIAFAFFARRAACSVSAPHTSAPTRAP